MDLSEARELLVPAAARPVAVFSPHPLQPAREREVLWAELLPGESLAAYFERSGIGAKIVRRPVIVTVNGARVPRELWGRCKPKPGTLINVYAVVRGGGGGGGKNPINTVLSIAMMAVAPWAATTLGASLGIESAFGLAALKVGIGVVGQLAVNALFPAPKPQLSQSQALAAQASPTYAITGGQNRMRPYEPLPVIMGKVRVFADLGAQPYTEFQGEDQYLFQVFDFGYNDVVLSDYQIGTDPIANFEGVTIEESGADGALTLFPTNVDSQAGGTLDPFVTITRTGSGGATRIAVEVTGTLFGVADSGALKAAVMAVNIKYRLTNAPTWTNLRYSSAGIGMGVAAADAADTDNGDGSVVFSWGSRSPLRRTFTWQVASGQYDVQVVRATPAYDAAHYSDQIVLSQVRCYQPDTADYTGRKRVAVRIKASGQLNGQISQFSALASSRCQAWDGAAWSSKETSSPAFWFLAAARGQFSGASRLWGAGLPDSRIDLEALKAFDAWCSASGLSFNAVFDQPIAAGDMLAAIAVCGRASTTWASGKLGVVWDAPDQPVVGVFGMSNIVRDSFEIEYLTANLADEIVCSFINPDLNWQRDTVRATVPGVASPANPTQVELIGCTDKAMAGQLASLYAAANRYRIARRRWQVDWEGMPVARGDVVQLSHDLASFDYSGRCVEGSSAAAIKLDRAVPLDASGGWVTLVKPDQSFAAYQVEPGAGNVDTLTFVSPLGFDPGADPNHPPYDYRWLFGISPTPGKKVKIEKYEPAGPGLIQITALDETPDYYSAARAGYTYVAPPSMLFGAAPTISNLQLTPVGIKAAGGYVVKVVATWDASADFTAADVSASTNGGPARIVGQEVRARTCEWIVQDGDAISVTVTGYGVLGRLGASASKTATLTVAFQSNLIALGSTGGSGGGGSTLPSLGLAGKIDTLDYVLAWGAPAGDLPVSAYEIRSGDTWATGTLVDRIMALGYRGIVSWTGSRTFWVAAVYYDGTLLSSPVSVTLTVSAEQDVSLAYDAQGNVTISFPVMIEPQILGYELRVGASFETGAYVSQTTGSSFTLSLLTAAGRLYWIKAKYDAGYSAIAYRADLSGALAPAPKGLGWRVVEPNLEFSWNEVAGAATYTVLWEDGGVAVTRSVAKATITLPIPKYSASIRVIAVSSAGVESPPADEDISVAGRYVFNEVVNIALPITTGKYVNLAFVNGNTIKRASLRGIAPAAPYAQNVNDGDLYGLGYNLAPVVASNFSTTPAAWFRKDFWKARNGYFESAVVDLGSVLSGRLALTLTKTIDYVGDGPVSAYGQVLAEYLGDTTVTELVDEKAFLSARFLCAADDPNSPAWVERQNGDWVDNVRYVKLVVQVERASPLTEITVTAGAITLDVPDVSETGSAAGVTSAGKAIVFAKTYNQVDVVIATARGAAKAYTGSITNAGCTLYVDTASATQVDYFVKGY